MAENQKRFSKRFGRSIQDKEIRIREDAPQELREFIVQTIYDYKYLPSFLRRVICRVLRRTPNANNWSECPNIEEEVNDLIETCEWYLVYDIIEALYSSISEVHRGQFEEELNDYFKVNGIGWKLSSGLIETRGDDTFETAVTNVVAVLEAARLSTEHLKFEKQLMICRGDQIQI